MKRIILGLLITGATLGSASYAQQKQETQHPLAIDSSICPDQLNMTQLETLSKNALTLNGHKFTLDTHIMSEADFAKMLPAKGRVISHNKSVAKIAERGRVIISKEILKCRYTFRTAVGSKLGKAHKEFTIMSEPVKVALSDKEQQLIADISKAG